MIHDKIYSLKVYLHVSILYKILQNVSKYAKTFAFDVQLRARNNLVRYTNCNTCYLRRISFPVQTVL